jgi:hypothetical protein
MLKEKIKLYKHSKKIILGTKNKLKYYENLTGYESDFVQIRGKFLKRLASKRVRKSLCISGNYYKKLYSWFEWS